MSHIPQPLIDAVCREMGITQEMFVSRRRFDHIVIARQMCAIVLRDKYRWTHDRIGWALNQKRTTITKSLKQASNLIKTNSRYKRLYELLMEL